MRRARTKHGKHEAKVRTILGLKERGRRKMMLHFARMMRSDIAFQRPPQCPITCRDCDKTPPCGGNGCVILTGGKHIPDDK